MILEKNKRLNVVKMNALRKKGATPFSLGKPVKWVWQLFLNLNPQDSQVAVCHQFDDKFC
jgi:hypothetical protein